MSRFNIGQHVVVMFVDQSCDSYVARCDEYIGAVGEVARIYSDGDVTVMFNDGVTLTYPDKCIEVHPNIPALDVTQSDSPTTTAYETRVTGMTVAPAGRPVFDEFATEIKIEDECGGEYIVLRQTWRDGTNGVAIEAGEWPVIRAAIDEMMKVVR